ncbi:MAG: hypothetical protein PHN46_00475 [Eubacteriales bacterium]|jgi:predicted metal-dependent phosphoesterase TrpH|nr:hypothetical protein [Eubacteriales bacterium]
MHVFALTEQALKINLHMHTSQSDGRLSPLEALKSYEDAGYDAVCLTDHRMLTLVSPRRDSEGTQGFSAMLHHGEALSSVPSPLVHEPCGRHNGP